MPFIDKFLYPEFEFNRDPFIYLTESYRHSKKVGAVEVFSAGHEPTGKMGIALLQAGSKTFLENRAIIIQFVALKNESVAIKFVFTDLNQTVETIKQDEVLKEVEKYKEGLRKSNIGHDFKFTKIKDKGGIIIAGHGETLVKCKGFGCKTMGRFEPGMVRKLFAHDVHLKLNLPEEFETLFEERSDNLILGLGLTRDIQPVFYKAPVFRPAFAT